MECGGWRGGSMLAAARTLIEQGDTTRELHLLTPSAAWSRPTTTTSHRMHPAAKRFAKQTRGDGGGSTWCEASVEEVRAAIALTRYPAERIRYVVGRLGHGPPDAPDRIALSVSTPTGTNNESTRTSSCTSTAHISGRVLIIDDYGELAGRPPGVDEYFAGRARPLLNAVDASAPLPLVTEEPGAPGGGQAAPPRATGRTQGPGR